MLSLAIESLHCESEYMEQRRYGVVLAGGVGSRLWPLSTEGLPKQFMDVRGSSLVMMAQERMKFFGCDDILLITGREHALLCERLCAPYAQLLIEPARKNTAAALLYTALVIAKKTPDALMICVPSDQVIEPLASFFQALEKATHIATQKTGLVLVGVIPTAPSSQYGYISVADTITPNHAQHVSCFIEKPAQDVAQKLLASEKVLWNTGMLVAQAHVILQAGYAWSLEVMTLLKKYHETGDAQYYAALPSISFDHAILEKSTECYVVPAEVMWSDVGSLDRFFQAFPQQRSMQEMNASGNCSYAQKKVVCMGVDNLRIIETESTIFVVAHDHLDHLAVLKHEGTEV